MTDVTIMQMIVVFLFLESFFVEYSFFTWILERLAEKNTKKVSVPVIGTCVVWLAAVLLTCASFGLFALPTFFP